MKNDDFFILLITNIFRVIPGINTNKIMEYFIFLLQFYDLNCIFILVIHSS